jgi:DNA adenine methylase
LVGIKPLGELQSHPCNKFLAYAYVDPPYTIASKRLYSHWQLDHRSLFRLVANVKGDILLTYDNTSEIAALASEFSFETQTIAMKNTHHAKMTELLIGKDLSWLRKATNGSGSGSRNSQRTFRFSR